MYPNSRRLKGTKKKRPKKKDSTAHSIKMRKSIDGIFKAQDQQRKSHTKQYLTADLAEKHAVCLKTMVGHSIFLNKKAL